jgi:membrane protease YdiL (CAAX protease family)
MDQPVAAPNAGQRVLRILQLPPIRGLLGFIWMLFALVAAQLAFAAVPIPTIGLVELLGALFITGASLAAYVLFVRVIERRPVTELAAAGAAVELGRGVLLGALLFTATLAIIWALGYYRVTGTNALSAVLPVLALSIISGVSEELIFRGIVFRILEESLGSVIALAISALFFGLLHLVNPNATLVAGLAIAIEAGILLGLAYMLTRRLWLAIGLHFAWNFVQGGIFGVAVSGNAVEGLLESTLTGPALLSGGPFGVEASVFAVLVCLGASAYLWRRVQQQDGVVVPFWKRGKKA